MNKFDVLLKIEPVKEVNLENFHMDLAHYNPDDVIITAWRKDKPDFMSDVCLSMFLSTLLENMKEQDWEEPCEGTLIIYKNIRFSPRILTDFLNEAGFDPAMKMIVNADPHSHRVENLKALLISPVVRKNAAVIHHHNDNGTTVFNILSHDNAITQVRHNKFPDEEEVDQLIGMGSN